MIRSWWLNLLERIGNYVNRPGAISHILMMDNNIMTLGYTYARCRFKKTPKFSAKLNTLAD